MGRKELDKEDKKVRTNIRLTNKVKKQANKHNINISRAAENALKLILDQLDEELEKHKDLIDKDQ